MKELEFPILTYIEITTKDLDITIIALIDTGSEVTFFKKFLLQTQEKFSQNKRVQVKGINSLIAYLKIFQPNVLIILGNKIHNIAL